MFALVRRLIFDGCPQPQGCAGGGSFEEHSSKVKTQKNHSRTYKLTLVTNIFSSETASRVSCKALFGL
jgi:hypothetical protein